MIEVADIKPDMLGTEFVLSDGDHHYLGGGYLARPDEDDQLADKGREAQIAIAEFMVEVWAQHLRVLRDAQTREDLRK